MPRHSGALRAWISAAKAEGYMKKGAAFKKLPKKGTTGYKRIKARYAAAPKRAAPKRRKVVRRKKRCPKGCRKAKK